MARQLSCPFQMITVVLIGLVSHFAAVELLPLTRVYIYGNWQMPLLAGFILLALFLHAAVRYRIKPVIWLVGIPVSCVLCSFWYTEGLYGYSAQLESFRFGKIPVYVFSVLIPVAEWGVALLIRHMQLRRWRQGRDYQQEVGIVKQIICTVIVYLILLYLWNQGAFLLFWRFSDFLWQTKMIIALISLLLFILAVVIYDVKPFLWLIGIPILLLCKLLFFPDDIMDFYNGAWQQMLPTEVYCVIVPMLYCAFGFFISLLGNRRRRTNQ